MGRSLLWGGLPSECSGDPPWRNLVVGRSPDRTTYATAGLKRFARRPAVADVCGSGDQPTTQVADVCGSGDLVVLHMSLYQSRSDDK